MTANEMRKYCLLLQDGAALEEMGYSDKEWSILLTRAELELVRDVFFANQNVKGEGFENGTKRDSQLVMLKSYAEVIPVDNNGIPYTNSWTATLPSDYLYNIQERCNQTKVINGQTVTYIDVSLKPMDEDYVNENTSNPYNIPDKRLVWRISNITDSTYPSYTRSRAIVLVTGIGYTPILYKSRYLRKPRGITVNQLVPGNAVDSELDSSTHDEICKIAVRIALGAVGSNKYQIADKEYKELI